MGMPITKKRAWSSENPSDAGHRVSAGAGENDRVSSQTAEGVSLEYQEMLWRLRRS